jgi:acetylornithine/N-succinyldiaminopimelate aminotransferase
MNLSQRQLFLNNLAQTSDKPLALEIEKAEGIYLTDINNKSYIDLISGISVSNIGHRHPKVLKAIQEQLDKYLYLMVYGEYVQSPQVQLAQMIASKLPPPLSSVYFTNSGSEANEGALKLAKRYTGRTEIVSFRNAYHGSTHGSLSIMGNEEFKNAFRPLLPDVKILGFNDIESLTSITYRTACVVIEPIQGEAGVILPSTDFLHSLRKKCDDTGALLIFDEIQTGFGRTGKLFAFEHFNVVPDIITIAKGMGGGMPIGAFISSGEIMGSLSHNPVLGHITTFGGHPVSCAASKACLEVIIEENLSEKAENKGRLILDKLNHHKILDKRGKGLMIAIEFESEEFNKKVIDKCIEKGVITDWFLFNSKSMRIAPPLTISEAEIEHCCELVLQCIEAV